MTSVIDKHDNFNSMTLTNVVRHRCYLSWPWLVCWGAQPASVGLDCCFNIAVVKASCPTAKAFALQQHCQGHLKLCLPKSLQNRPGTRKKAVLDEACLATLWNLRGNRRKLTGLGVGKASKRLRIWLGFLHPSIHPSIHWHSLCRPHHEFIYSLACAESSKKSMQNRTKFFQKSPQNPPKTDPQSFQNPSKTLFKPSQSDHGTPNMLQMRSKSDLFTIFQILAIFWRVRASQNQTKIIRIR